MRIHLVYLSRIDLWSLDNFDFAYGKRLNRVNILACLSNGLIVGTSSQMLNQIIDIYFGDFFCQMLIDFLTNSFNLWALSIWGLFDLIMMSLCEGYSEESQNVTIRCFYINISINKSLPFTDHLTQLISCNIHTIEACSQVWSFNFIYNQSDFSPGKLIRLFL